MTRDAIPTFELCSRESWRDPFGMYAALRDHDPVHHCARGDFYILTRFADVWAAAGDSATFSSARGLTVRYGDVEATGMGDAVPMVFLDPPEHTAFRRLVNKGLSPRKVSTIEPDIRRFVVDRIERLREMGEADIVADLFNPLASFVVAHYLGVPDEDRALFGRWSEAIVQAVAGGDPTAAGDPFTELLTYFATLVRHRRTAPGDDIVSDLVRMGEDTVSIARILGFAFTMVTGGNDTVTGMLSGSSCLLTQHRDQRAKLLAAPSLIPNAVEELLRLTSPVQNLARTATRDVELHGARIPAGRKVLLCYAAANRDDREFGPTAAALDVERKITKILTFSYGTHYCIGAAAARLQSRVALEELLSRCPDFDVDVERGCYAQGHYVRRHESLPWVAH
jgi:cytochrome P450 family 130